MDVADSSRGVDYWRHRAGLEEGVRFNPAVAAWLEDGWVPLTELDSVHPRSRAGVVQIAGAWYRRDAVAEFHARLATDEVPDARAEAVPHPEDEHAIEIRVYGGAGSDGRGLLGYVPRALAEALSPHVRSGHVQVVPLATEASAAEDGVPRVHLLVLRRGDAEIQLPRRRWHEWMTIELTPDPPNPRAGAAAIALHAGFQLRLCTDGYFAAVAAGDEARARELLANLELDELVHAVGVLRREFSYADVRSIASALSTLLSVIHGWSPALDPIANAIHDAFWREAHGDRGLDGPR